MCRVGALSGVRTVTSSSACAMLALCFMTKQEQHISDKKELCVMGEFFGNFSGPSGLGKCDTLLKGVRGWSDECEMKSLLKGLKRNFITSNLTGSSSPNLFTHSNAEMKSKEEKVTQTKRNYLRFFEKSLNEKEKKARKIFINIFFFLSEIFIWKMKKKSRGKHRCESTKVQAELDDSVITSRRHECRNHSTNAEI